MPSLGTLKLGDLNVDMWYGVFAPAGTPRAMVDRLNAELRGRQLEASAALARALGGSALPASLH